MKLLNETLKKIEGLNEEVMKMCKERVDNLVKPQGSLGKLEDIAVKLSGITGKLHPKVDNRAIIVMAADNGVCEEGIASAPQVVTKIQTINIVNGKTGVAALAAQARADVITVDIGILEDINHKNVINKKIKYGTDNIIKGSAMTREEAIKAIEVGIEIANNEIKNGRNLLGTGEMGIGNTTTTTAILSVLGNLDPEEITGVGANLLQDKLSNKIDVIKKAIEINKPNKEDAVDVLAKVGGLDIAGMAGVMIAGAANRTPVVVDGYISTIAALVATKIEPKVKDYLICSHASKEKAASKASELLDFKPMLDMGMRLGEGSGAALAFNIIEAATYMNDKMITFEEASIDVV